MHVQVQSAQWNGARVALRLSRIQFRRHLRFVMAHVEGADGWLNTHNKHGEHAWIHLHGLGLDLLHATSLAFFASGYIDLVAAPPKTLQASFKRVASGIAVWLLWQPIAVFLGIETSTNIWPILLLSIFRAIVWPMRLCLLNWRRARLECSRSDRRGCVFRQPRVPDPLLRLASRMCHCASRLTR